MTSNHGHENAPGAAATAPEGKDLNTQDRDQIMTNTIEPDTDALAADAITDPAEAAELARAAWLEAHPAVSEALPTWADDVYVYLPETGTNEPVTVDAMRELGPFYVAATGAHTGDRFNVTRYSFGSDTISDAADTPAELAYRIRARALELLTLAYTLESEATR